MTQVKTTLKKPKEILTEIKKLLNPEGPKPLVIFDLDSTLFDVSPRLEKVLIDISMTNDFIQRFPEVNSYFRNIKTLRNDWGFIKVLKRAGVDHDHYELFDYLRHAWAIRFFSNEYIHHDVPYDGASLFVNRIHKLGIPIVYLTGRDVQRMELGSKEVLQKWDFPLNDKNATLVLKPQKEMDDAQFKCDWIKSLNLKEYSKIYLFENEPVNINLIKKELPEVEMVFFDSTHSGKEPPPSEINTLIHYLLDDES
ncbi:MAG: HAD family hydrolase [Bdellovibrionaceae bacterium]|nr:HAD family hydrolase [Pseudobdellovibrionaceae bacterium]NUM57439.1 HAD family hydrolase [Pseudobdellovibrionaceae bacterium]